MQLAWTGIPALVLKLTMARTSTQPYQPCLQSPSKVFIGSYTSLPNSEEQNNDKISQHYILMLCFLQFGALDFGTQTQLYEFIDTKDHLMLQLRQKINLMSNSICLNQLVQLNTMNEIKLLFSIYKTTLAKAQQDLQNSLKQNSELQILNFGNTVSAMKPQSHLLKDDNFSR